MPVEDMKLYHEKEKEKLISEVKELKSKGIIPRLWIITNGKDEKCKTYMKSKLNIANEIGVEVDIKYVSTCKELDNTVREAYLNYIPVILQLPIDSDLEEYYKNLPLIYKNLDVDGFFSYQYLMEGDWSNAPCTAKGVANYILDMFESIRGKVIVLVGYGKLTNKPLSTMLLDKGATCVVVNSSTPKIFKSIILEQADIVVCASGLKGSVKVSELSSDKKVLCVNVGTMFDENGRLTTELEVDKEKDNVVYTPRVGGTGLLTTTNLMLNVLNFYKKCNLAVDKDKLKW